MPTKQVNKNKEKKKKKRKNKNSPPSRRRCRKRGERKGRGPKLEIKEDEKVSDSDENESTCPWQFYTGDICEAQAGSIGFNGHQVILHCYTPGEPYLARNRFVDPCSIEVGILPTGEQTCVITYEDLPRKLKPKTTQTNKKTNTRNINELERYKSKNKQC